MLTLRIIGKFAGYIIFSPYRTVFIPNYLKKEMSLSRHIVRRLSPGCWKIFSCHKLCLIQVVPIEYQILYGKSDSAQASDSHDPICSRVSEHDRRQCNVHWNNQGDFRSSYLHIQVRGLHGFWSYTRLHLTFFSQGLNRWKWKVKVLR